MAAPSFQQVEPLPARPRGLGCGSIVLLGLCIPLFAFLGIMGGLACYGLAWGFGTPSVGVSIAAGVIALVIIYLSAPFGTGLGLALLPSNEHPLLKSVATVAAAVLVPFFAYQEVLFLAVPVAIAAGLMFYWCQPPLASILLGVLSPLAGLGIGMALVAQVGDSGSAGGGDWGDSGGGGDGE